MLSASGPIVSECRNKRCGSACVELLRARLESRRPPAPRALLASVTMTEFGCGDSEPVPASLREAVRGPSAPRASLASVRMTDFGVACFGQDDRLAVALVWMTGRGKNPRTSRVRLRGSPVSSASAAARLVRLPELGSRSEWACRSELRLELQPLTSRSALRSRSPLRLESQQWPLRSE